jgi:hypothetical protein
MDSVGKRNISESYVGLHGVKSNTHSALREHKIQENSLIYATEILCSINF